MEKIANWRRWEIFLETIDGQKIATKKAIDKEKKWAINKEIVILKKLNKLWIQFVPQLLESWDWYFQYNYIEWKHFITEYRNSEKKRKNILINNLLEKVFELDKMGIIHWELIKPYTNILVWKNDDISIIDFERGKIEDFSWKNMRSFSQWLKNEWYINIQNLKKIWKTKTAPQIYKFLKEKIMKRNYLKIIVYSLFLIALDQLSKYLFYNLNIFSNNYFFTSLLNNWISWWIDVNNIIVVLISFLAIVSFVFLYKKRYISQIVLILLISGAIWNLIDRIFIWWVRDFINLHIWPVFNFADIYLSISMMLIIFEEFFKKKK